MTALTSLVSKLAEKVKKNIRLEMASEWSKPLSETVFYWNSSSNKHAWLCFNDSEAM